MNVSARRVWVCAVGALGVACSGGGPGAPERVGSSASADSTECNSGPYVDGVDVYDGTGTIDFVALKASGVDFAIIKATQGNYDTQTTFAANWANAKAAGVVRGAYHFFDPTIDGATQAAYFLGVMGKLEKGDMPPMLDIECPDGDPDCLGFASGAASGSAITTGMNDWLNAVKAATGVLPILYTFESYFSGAGVDTTGLESFPLDIGYPTTSTCFGVPSPWASATLWQNSWTGTVGGISGQVDTDRFLGTLAQFQAFLVGGGGAVAPFSPPSSYNGNLVMSVLSWPDEHVELFAETTKGRAVHLYTTGTGDTWSAAAPLTGPSSCGIASVAWPPKSGRSASAFDALPDGTTEDATYGSSAWSAFASLGGAGLSRLSTLGFDDGHVEVFGLGTDGAIWHDVWSVGKKAWSGWESLGGSDLVTGAAPILWGDGHAEIFATDASGVAWHDWTASSSSAAWHGWAAMTGGKLATRPVPARWADGHVEVFARGTDNRLYVSNDTGGTWPALTVVNAGTEIQGEPSVVVYPAYGPEVFARDPKGELMHAWTSGTSLVAWASDFDEVLGSDPLVWMRPDGQAEVFGVDTKGELVKSIHDGAEWSSWSTLATGIDPCVSVPTPSPPPPPGKDGGVSGTDSGTHGGHNPEGGSGTGHPGASPSASGCACEMTRGRETGDSTRFFWMSLLGFVGLATRRSRRD